MMDKLALEGLAQSVVDIYNSLEHDMLVNIAKRLSGKDSLLKTDPEAWQLQQLQNLGMLNKDNLKLIKKYTGLTSAQLNSIIYGASLDGLDTSDEALKKATKQGAHLKVPTPVSESPIILNIIKAYQEQAANILNLTNQTMLKQAHNIYTDIINRTVVDVMSGFKTPDQALRKTIRQWAEYGVPALIDKAGKKWGPEGYVRTVIVTTTNNTIHKTQDMRFNQWGINLVEVTSHSGARPLCAPYQGRIFRIDGSDTKYKNLYTDTSYGKPAGLFGINCGHHKFPYIDGVSTQTYFPYPKKENEIVYQQSQQQRALERSIRKAKTQLDMYTAMGDDEGIKQASALVKKRQASMRNFIDSTGRTRRRDREQIVKTGDVQTKPLPKVPKPVPHVQQAPAKVDFNNVNVGDSVKYKDKNGQVFGGIVDSKITDEVHVKSNLNGQLYWAHKDNLVEHLPTQNTTVTPPSVQKSKPTPQKKVTINNVNISNIDESQFTNIDSSFDSVVRDKEVFNQMATKDVKIVKRYTSNHYRTMNGVLRGLRSDDGSVAKENDHLIKVLNTNSGQMQGNIKLFRQMDSDALSYLLGDDITNKLKDAQYSSNQSVIDAARNAVIGGAIQDKAFVSTTHREGAFGSGYDIKLVIHVPQGYKNGMFVESISEFSSEKEYLFNANTKFDIFDLVFESGKIIFKVIPT